MTTSETRSPVLLIEISTSSESIQLADLEFGSSVFLQEEFEYLGHPIATEPPLGYDANPPREATIRIDVPDSDTTASLSELPDGSRVTLSFCDEYCIPVSWSHTYVLAGVHDRGGVVRLDLIEAETVDLGCEQVSLWPREGPDLSPVDREGLERIVREELHQRIAYAEAVRQAQMELVRQVGDALRRYEATVASYRELQRNLEQIQGDFRSEHELRIRGLVEQLSRYL